MAPATAPQRTIAPERAPEVDVRPDLRVIEGIDDSPSRRSFTGLVGTVSVVLLFVCIFGVVVFQVLLVQTQSHLDDLGGGLATQDARAEALDLEMANLESPERVVAAAEGLGMITPNKIVHLESGPDDDVLATLDPVSEPMGTTAPTAPTDPASADAGATGSGGDGGTGTAATGTTTPAAPSGPALPPGPPYTAENNWGAGGPPTTPPAYTAENNWGAGPTPTTPAGTR